MTQTATLELLTNEYFWNIGSSKTLKTMVALDTVTIGNTSNEEPYTNITTSNVTSNFFIGNLDGQVGSLSVTGNMSGSVLIQGEGTTANTMNLEIELDDVNSATPGPFGSQTQIPTFKVDKYGRVSQVANVTISTTLNLLDTTGDTGAVDLLNGDLKIDGTNNQIVSQVSGNTFTLSLDSDMNMENLSLSGNLDVTKATSLNSTLAVGGAATLEESLDVVKASSLHSTLAVGGAATLEESLDVVKASSLHSTLAVGGAATLEESLDVVKASSLHSTLAVGGASTLEDSLDVIKASSLHSTLAVGGAATLEESLDVVKASSLHSILAVGGAVTLEESLDVVKASSLHSTLSVGGAATLEHTLDVVKASSLHSTLAVGGASTLESTLYVGELVEFNKDLVIQGNLTVNGTQTIIDTTILAIEDNKIELNTDGDVQAFGIYANVPSHGGEISLYYEVSSSRWELNRDLYVSGNLTVSDSTTIQDSLDVVGASSLHSTLAVAGASTLENSLDVVKASSLHSTLAVGGAATLESTLDVVKASSLHSTLAVGGASTLEDSLDVVKASSLHSTLAVGGAATLEESLDVVKASSLHSTLEVGGATTLNSSLKVVGVSTYLDNIIAQKDVTINGNIFVRGNLTQVDAETILLSDPLIVIGNSNENTYQDLGFKFVKSASADDYGYFGWDGSNSQFSFYETANIVDNDLQSGGNLGTVAAEKFIGNVVQASSFVGPLQGTAVSFQNSLTLDFCGNVLGSVTFFGNEVSLDVPLKLQSVFANPNSFGNSISVPTITVDTYGRVTDISENSISTTLNLLDTSGDTGIVDLLNGDLRINGTSRQVVSDVVDNTFTLTLPNNLLVEDVSMSGMLQVDGATTLESTLDVVKSSSLHSTLAVGGAATLEESLDVVKASSLHSTLAVGGAATLEDSLDVVKASSLHSTLAVGSAATLESSLDVVKASSLHSTLAIGGAATLEESLDVVKASSLHSTLAVGGAATLEESLDVVKASSLHSILAVGGAVTLEESLDVVKASSLHSTLAVGGAATLEESLDVVKASSLHSTLAVGGAATLESSLEVVANITTPTYIIKDNTSSNTITLVAPDLSSGSYTLTLPGTDGITNQFLQTNGSGTLSWVTPDDAKTIKANVIDTADYTTETDNEMSLSDYTISYTTTIQPSSVMLQHKIPYESSIHANQRIKFKITKNVNGITSNIGYPDVLGPNNATGGTRGIYISNIIDETDESIGTTVTFNISAQLTTNTTAVDSNGVTRQTGVRAGPDYGVGTVMLTEFKN